MLQFTFQRFFSHLREVHYGQRSLLFHCVSTWYGIYIDRRLAQVTLVKPCILTVQVHGTPTFLSFVLSFITIFSRTVCKILFVSNALGISYANQSFVSHLFLELFYVSSFDNWQLFRTFSFFLLICLFYPSLPDSIGIFFHTFWQYTFFHPFDFFPGLLWFNGHFMFVLFTFP